MKESSEDIALEWSDEEKSKCIDETGKAFKCADATDDLVNNFH